MSFMFVEGMNEHKQKNTNKNTHSFVCSKETKKNIFTILISFQQNVHFQLFLSFSYLYFSLFRHIFFTICHFIPYWAGSSLDSELTGLRQCQYPLE